MIALRSIASILLGCTVALGLLASSQLLNIHFVHAQVEANDVLNDGSSGETFFSDKAVQETIAGLIKVAIGFFGVIAVAITLLGGFEWMTASGSTEATKQAKSTMANGFVALVVIVSVYAIASFIISALVEKTN